MKTSPAAREEGGASPLAEAKAPWLRRHGGDLLAALALAAFTLVIFWKALADPAGMIGGDAAYLYQDYYTMAAREVQAGRIPLWNPYILMGVPFHASLQPALFYPLRWQMFWMDYVPGFVFTLCLHYFLGAVAAYLLVRVAMRVGPLPGVVGAMSIVFGGFALGHASHPNYFLSYPWFFGSVLCLWLAMDRRQWRWVPPAGACLGLMMLVGSVHLLLILSVLLGTLAAAFAVAACADWARAGAGGGPGTRGRGAASGTMPAKPQAGSKGQVSSAGVEGASGSPAGWREVARPIGAVSAALALGVLVGAIQLWPAYGLYKTSSRGGDDSDPRVAKAKYDRITFGSANPQRTALQMVAPFYYGDMRLGYWGEVSHDEMAHYTGLVTLVLAAVGIVGIGRDRRRWAMAAVGLAGVAFGTGKFFPHFYDALYSLLPPFRALRFPTRIEWCTDIALSCLGAWGLQRLLAGTRGKPARAAGADLSERPAKRARAAATLVAAVAVVVLAGALIQLREYAHSPLAAQEAVRGNDEIHEDVWFASRVQAAQDAPRRIFAGDGAIWMGVAAAVLGAALVAGLAWRRKPAGRLAQAAIVTLLAGDLLAMSFGMAMYCDAFDLMRQPSAVARWVRDHEGLQRCDRQIAGRTQTSHEMGDVNRGMLLGYRQADGLGGGILDSPTRSDFLGLMLQQVYIPGPSGPRPTLSLVHKLKDVAAVRYFLVNPDGKFPADEVGLRPVPNDTGFQVLENPSCLPAAFFVRSVREVGPGSGDALQVLGFNGRQPITQPLDEALSAIAGDDFDPNETAAVLGKTSPDVLSSKARSARVLETKTVPGRWEIATDADAPGQLVISEGYDPGWRCEIDEKPAAVYQTDDQIMSVSVPAGKHAVLLKYDPPEFRRGAWVTVVGIVLLLACAAAGFVVGARKRAPASQFS